ncbi:MAG: L-seryl-tRNA(Sec) selenium transferase [Thermodesulfobacteriota bacterium]
MSLHRERILRALPSVEEALQAGIPAAAGHVARGAVLEAIRMALSRAREMVLECAEEKLEEVARDRAQWLKWLEKETLRLLGPSLRPVVNATGVIVHTNLGRSVLAQRAVAAVAEVASRYSNLEYDLENGKRGSRQSHLENLLQRLTGAQAAAVVNNNAAAVLISLRALARGKEVIVSWGELVERGGAFLMPEVMIQSGARLVEVGTTNKTHPRDYREAITGDTALLLKVHTSNYRIMGFAKEVSLQELVQMGREAGIPVMYDLGSGCLVDLAQWADEAEPTVQEAIRAGADLITFSGDKLLGGPQAGLILGRKELVERIKGHPLARALRIDKLTLAALQATLELYFDPQTALSSIPTLRMMMASPPALRSKARRLSQLIRKRAPRVEVRLREDHSRVGGGALPLLELPTWSVGVKLPGVSAQRLAMALRGGDPPIVARVSQEELLLDPRTIDDSEIPVVAESLARCTWELLGEAAQ